VSAADSFDAMTSDRAYRTALPRREACRRLRSGAGRQFDPRVIDALLRVVGCGPLRRS
jgi:HD-GYP domain-containing protein (c-di-GMP phosphodiesterase class II)